MRRMNRALMSRTITVHLRYTTTRNDQVLPILENVCHGGKSFGFPFGIDRWHYIFSLSINLVISRCCLAEKGNEMYKGL